MSHSYLLHQFYTPRNGRTTRMLHKITPGQKCQIASIARSQPDIFLVQFLKNAPKVIPGLYIVFTCGVMPT